MSDTVTYELDDAVAVVTIDDGKANAITHDVIDALNGALDRSLDEAHATVIVGRPGKLSAGFDLGVMTAGLDEMRGLVTAGAELLIRVYTHPMPVVAGCTGHALAAGALLLCACDTRLGADGEAKIGLNEVAIGMSLPIFAIELARDRLSRRHFTPATQFGRVYDPATAVEAGFLDAVVPAATVVDAARAEGRRLAELPTGAVGATKRLGRQPSVQYIRDTLAADMASLNRGPSPR